MNLNRIDHLMQAWARNAAALLLCLLVGAIIVSTIERAGWIYTTGVHTMWVSATLFLCYLARKDVRYAEQLVQPPTTSADPEPHQLGANGANS